MAISRKITAEASAPNGRLTFAELADFVDACHSADVSPDATLAVLTKGMSGQMSKIETVDPR